MSSPAREVDKLKVLRRQKLAAVLALCLPLVLFVALDSASNVPYWINLTLPLVFVGNLVLFLVSSVRLRRSENAVVQASGAPPPVPKLRTSVALAVCWFALDAFALQQGFISAILIILSILWMVPSAVMARKEKTLFRFRSGRAAAYLLAAIASLGVIRANGYLARHRAEVVIAAVREYRQKYGQYPQRLPDITPEFLPSIPLARYSFAWNKFYYRRDGDNARLYYVAYPPYLRNVYGFESGAWGQID